MVLILFTGPLLLTAGIGTIMGSFRAGMISGSLHGRSFRDHCMDGTSVDLYSRKLPMTGTVRAIFHDHCLTSDRIYGWVSLAQKTTQPVEQPVWGRLGADIVLYNLFFIRTRSRHFTRTLILIEARLAGPLSNDRGPQSIATAR